MPDPRQSGSEGRREVTIRLLHISGCPNTEAARVLVSEILRELGRTEEISEVLVSDGEQAQALKFPGSPTIRVDEVDVETPPSGQTRYGLCCRMYVIEGRLRGTPTREMIRKAILLDSRPKTETKE